MTKENNNKSKETLIVITISVIFVACVILVMFIIQETVPSVEMCNSELDFFEKERRGCFG